MTSEAGEGREGQGERDQSTKWRLMNRMPVVLVEVRAYFFQSARPWFDISQPVWACQRPAQTPRTPLAVADVRAVGVALFVGVGVVLAVVGDPGDDRALHRHRAEHREGVFERLRGLEGAMGEQAVEADRDPDRGERT